MNSNYFCHKAFDMTNDTHNNQNNRNISISKAGSLSVETNNMSNRLNSVASFIKTMSHVDNPEIINSENDNIMRQSGNLRHSYSCISYPIASNINNNRQIPDTSLINKPSLPSSNAVPVIRNLKSAVSAASSTIYTARPAVHNSLPVVENFKSAVPDVNDSVHITGPAAVHNAFPVVENFQSAVPDASSTAHITRPATVHNALPVVENFKSAVPDVNDSVHNALPVVKNLKSKVPDVNDSVHITGPAAVHNAFPVVENFQSAVPDASSRVYISRPGVPNAVAVAENLTSAIPDASSTTHNFSPLQYVKYAAPNANPAFYRANFAVSSSNPTTQRPNPSLSRSIVTVPSVNPTAQNIQSAMPSEKSTVHRTDREVQNFTLAIPATTSIKTTADNAKPAVYSTSSTIKNTNCGVYNASPSVNNVNSVFFDINSAVHNRKPSDHNDNSAFHSNKSAVRNASVTDRNASTSSHNDSSTVYKSNYTVLNTSTPVDNVNSAIHNASSALHNVSTAVYNDNSTVFKNTNAATRNTSSTVSDTNSAVHYVKTAVHNAASTGHNVRSAIQNTFPAANSDSAKGSDVNFAVHYVKTTVHNANSAVHNVKTAIHNVKFGVHKADSAIHSPSFEAQSPDSETNRTVDKIATTLNEQLMPQGKEGSSAMCSDSNAQLPLHQMQLQQQHLQHYLYQPNALLKSNMLVQKTDRTNEKAVNILNTYSHTQTKTQTQPTQPTQHLLFNIVEPIAHPVEKSISQVQRPIQLPKEYPTQFNSYTLQKEKQNPLAHKISKYSQNFTNLQTRNGSFPFVFPTISPQQRGYTQKKNCRVPGPIDAPAKKTRKPRKTFADVGVQTVAVLTPACKNSPVYKPLPVQSALDLIVKEVQHIGIILIQTEFEIENLESAYADVRTITVANYKIRVNVNTVPEIVNGEKDILFKFKFSALAIKHSMFLEAWNPDVFIKIISPEFASREVFRTNVSKIFSDETLLVEGMEMQFNLLSIRKKLNNAMTKCNLSVNFKHRPILRHEFPDNFYIKQEGLPQDVIIETNDGQEINTNRMIIELFTNNIISAMINKRFKVPVKKADMIIILKVIHLQDVAFPDNYGELHRILSIAHYYNLTIVHNRCQDFLMFYSTQLNLFSKYKLADRFRLYKLQRYCMYLIMLVDAEKHPFIFEGSIPHFTRIEKKTLRERFVELRDKILKTSYPENTRTQRS